MYKSKDKYRFPKTVTAAIERAANELRVPTIVRADFNNKFKNVTGASFEGYEDEEETF